MTVADKVSCSQIKNSWQRKILIRTSLSWNNNKNNNNNKHIMNGDCTYNYNDIDFYFTYRLFCFSYTTT